jgi:hypothetical protein
MMSRKKLRKPQSFHILDAEKPGPAPGFFVRSGARDLSP